MNCSESTTEVFRCKAPSPDGLHLRSAGVMARGLAELTPDSVQVRVVNTLTQREGDGKAILDVLSLGLGGDVTFEVHVKGEKSAISLVKDQIRRFLLSYISTDDVTPQKS